MALTFLIVSCVETNDQLTTKSQSYLEHCTLLTKAATDALSAGVTAEDVENYLKCRMRVQASDIQEISRYDIDEDAAIYFVNYDMQGHLLEQNVNTHNYFRWHYNTGDVPNTCFWGTEGYYYPYNPVMHIGWSQY